MTKPIPHGTLSGYTNHKCRCDDCRHAMATYNRELRRSKGIQPPKRAQHGSPSKYRAGCRCEECVAAKSADRSQRYWGKKHEAEAFAADTKPVETKKYRHLVEEALRAFSLDAGYVVAMAQAASANDLPQEQLRSP